MYRAFTLIELLVVVAIIGILSAIGIVGWKGYTSLAKERVCIYNFNLLEKMIKQTASYCEGNKTVKLKSQYWNSVAGVDYDFQCGYTIGTVANEVLKSFTNFVKDPYNPTNPNNVDIYTWDGTPWYNGMIALYGTRLRTMCGDKQLEKILL